MQTLTASRVYGKLWVHCYIYRLVRGLWYGAHDNADSPAHRYE